MKNLFWSLFKVLIIFSCCASTPLFSQNRHPTAKLPILAKMKIKKGYIICDDTEFSIIHKNLDGVIDHDLLAGGHHFGHDYKALSSLIGKRLKLN